MSSNFGFTSFGNLGSIVQQVQQVATQVSQFQQCNHMYNIKIKGGLAFDTIHSYV